MPRKRPVTSAAAAVTLLDDERRGLIPPPDHLEFQPSILPFWWEIVKAKPRSEWEATPSLLVAAANLAWTQKKIVDLRKLVDKDNYMTAKDAMADLNALVSLQKNEMAYLRVLQQHGRAVDGEAGVVAKRRAQQRAIVDSVPDEDDGLLALPGGAIQ